MSKKFTKSYAINRIAELNEQIVEMTDNQNQTMRYLNRIRDENNQLKQQLEEKDKLLKCYQEEEKLIADILGDKDLTIIGSRVHLKNLIVELKNKIKDRDIVIEEKDKEIERLKIFEKAYYYNQLQASQEDIQKFQNLANQSAVNINYIAIQELEKVKDTLKHFCEIHSDEFYGVKSQVKGIEQDVCEEIDNQIKLLKGEKDVKD